MVTSQNGYVAGRLDLIDRDFAVAGVEFPGGVRHGAVNTVLRHVARRIHENVEPLREDWCWGYAYRKIRGGGELSNHASGTAIDINAPRHPIGVRGTWSPAQRIEIRRILDECSGAVRWGGSYTGRPDEMHFEIDKPLAYVSAVARELRRESDMPLDASDARLIFDTPIWRHDQPDGAKVRDTLSQIHLASRTNLAALRRLAELVGWLNEVTPEQIADALRVGLAAELVPVIQEVLGDAFSADIADAVMAALAARLQMGEQ